MIINKNKFLNNRFLINKKKLIIVIFMLILSLISLVSNHLVFADDNSSINRELSISVNEIVDSINLGDLENIVADLDCVNLFNTSVKDKIIQVLNGEYFTNYSNVFTAIISIFFTDIRQVLPLVFTLLAIGILANILSEFKYNNDGLNDVVYFICFAVMVITILFSFQDILKITSKTLVIILKQMQIIFPLLITMLTSIGSLSTVSIYNPMVAILTNVVSVIFEKFLYPIFIIMFLLTILGNISNTIKLDKFQLFLTSLFKWSIGIVFTLYAGILSIQGISAGKFDSVGIKATKFAVKSYIPIIGSYISDGMDFLVLGSVLVKNTIGLVGTLILFVSIISPIISILVVKFAIQLCSAVLEISGSNKMSNFLNGCSKILIYPIVLILGISFMYIITITLIMCTANIF